MENWNCRLLPFCLQHSWLMLNLGALLKEEILPRHFQEHMEGRIALFIPTVLPEVWQEDAGFTAPWITEVAAWIHPGSGSFFYPSCFCVVSEPSIRFIHLSLWSFCVTFDLEPTICLKCWHKYICRMQLIVDCHEQKVSRQIFSALSMNAYSLYCHSSEIHLLFHTLLFLSQSVWPHELGCRKEVRPIRPKSSVKNSRVVDSAHLPFH